MDAEKQYKTSRLPSLGKLIAQPMAEEASQTLTFRQKLDRWMINEGIHQFQDSETDG
jgi:hypothetical protein